MIVNKERKKEIVAGLEKAIAMLEKMMKDGGIREQLEKMLGMPDDVVPEAVNFLAAQRQVTPEMAAEIAPLCFDIFILAAALGYAQGVRVGGDALAKTTGGVQ